MEVVVIGFIVIIVLGALFGGESFGGVIGTGIVVAIFIGLAFFIYIQYDESQREEEYKKEQQQSDREEELKAEMTEKLSIEEKKSTDTNFLYFSNKCDKEVELYIHMLDTSGDWKTYGSWNFSANESAYLSSSNERLRTNNSILFYHLSGDGIYFSGDYKFTDWGDTYNMKKISDNYDDTEWSYSCE